MVEIPGRPGAEEILRDLGFVRLYYPINKTPRQSVAARPTSSAWFQVMNPLLHERERAALPKNALLARLLVRLRKANLLTLSWLLLVNNEKVLS